MKQCPTCSRTYTDEALSFCLDDGTPLLATGGGAPQSFDPNATIQFNPARDTNPPPSQGYQGSYDSGQQQPPPSSGWSPMPQVGGMQSPPPKKSKALVWILGGVGALVVLGIVGVVLVVILANMGSSNSNNVNANNTNTANRNGNANNTNTATSNTNTGPAKNYIAQDDFSSANWWTGSNAFGKAEYVNGEYQLTAGSPSGYVAVYDPRKFETQDATTRVTTHSVTGTSPSLGYGLTVYSLLKDGQLEDYAFIIKTDEEPAYRVALHRGGKETTLVAWTKSSQIRSGSASNLLEVRASSSQLSFYINGQFATSVTDSAGYKAGAAGLYTSDTQPVAFDDLEIYK